MVFELPVTLLIQHLEDALAKGHQEDAREAFTSLLTVGKLWLEEIKKSPSSLLVEQGRLFTSGMDSYDRMLRRNAEIVEYAPFLIGQHVEAERIGYGRRTIWVPGAMASTQGSAFRAGSYSRARANSRQAPAILCVSVRPQASTFRLSGQGRCGLKGAATSGSA